MKVYNYNPVTLEYTNHGYGQPDPVNEGCFLTPLYSTTKPPLEPREFETVIFNVDTDNWEYAHDYRGMEVHATDGSGRSIKINDIGIHPDDLDFPPLPELSYAEKRAREYPSLQDQMDALVKFFEGIPDKKAISRTSKEWEDMCTKCMDVKAKYPKDADK